MGACVLAAALLGPAAAECGGPPGVALWRSLLPCGRLCAPRVCRLLGRAPQRAAGLLLPAAGRAATCLEGVRLAAARPQGVCLAATCLQGVRLAAAHLERVRLAAARPEGACLAASLLQGGALAGVRVERGTLQPCARGSLLGLLAVPAVRSAVSPSRLCCRTPTTLPRVTAFPGQLVHGAACAHLRVVVGLLLPTLWNICSPSMAGLGGRALGGALPEAALPGWGSAPLACGAAGDAARSGEWSSRGGQEKSCAAGLLLAACAAGCGWPAKLDSGACSESDLSQPLGCAGSGLCALAGEACPAAGTLPAMLGAGAGLLATGAAGGWGCWGGLACSAAAALGRGGLATAGLAGLAAAEGRLPSEADPACDKPDTWDRAAAEPSCFRLPEPALRKLRARASDSRSLASLARSAEPEEASCSALSRSSSPCSSCATPCAARTAPLHSRAGMHAMTRAQARLSDRRGDEDAHLELSLHACHLCHEGGVAQLLGLRPGLCGLLELLVHALHAAPRLSGCTVHMGRAQPCAAHLELLLQRRQALGHCRLGHGSRSGSPVRQAVPRSAGVRPASSWSRDKRALQQLNTGRAGCGRASCSWPADGAVQLVVALPLRVERLQRDLTPSCAAARVCLAGPCVGLPPRLHLYGSRASPPSEPTFGYRRPPPAAIASRPLCARHAFSWAQVGSRELLTLSRLCEVDSLQRRRSQAESRFLGRQTLGTGSVSRASMQTELPALTGRRAAGPCARRTGGKQAVCVATPTRPPAAKTAKRWVWHRL